MRLLKRPCSRDHYVKSLSSVRPASSVDFTNARERKIGCVSGGYAPGFKVTITLSKSFVINDIMKGK